MTAPPPSTARPHISFAVDDVDAHWDVLDDADAIIFGSPTYMAGASAPFKAFLDATSPRWAEQRWRDKLAAGFTNSAGMNGDKLATLQQFALFAMQHGMVWVGLGLLPGNHTSDGSPDDLNRLAGFLGAMAQSNADQGPELVPPLADRRTAEHLGRRVAELAGRLASPARRSSRSPRDHRRSSRRSRTTSTGCTTATPTAADGVPPPGGLRLGDRRRARPPHDGRVLPDRRRAAVARLPPRAAPDRVVSIELVGPVTAVARVECAIGPKRFDDVLTLVRLDDRWQIIAKVFHYELAEEA